MANLLGWTVPKFLANVHLLPLVFVYLWTLIIFDMKNFKASRKACKEYTARDPVNCYQRHQLTPSSKQDSSIK